MQRFRIRLIFTIVFILTTLSFNSLFAGGWKLAIKPAFSIPISEFASHHLHSGSFAEPGFSGSVEIKHRVFKNWSLAADFGFALHAVDVSALGLETVQNDPFMEDVYIRSEAIRQVFFMAGTSYTLTLVGRFTAEAAIKAGFLHSQTPYQLYKPKYFMTGPAYYEITSAKDYSAVFLAEIAFYYPIKECYEAGVNFQWLNATPEFGFHTSGGIRVDKRTVQMLNLGLVWRFRF
ncbi:MAG: hypothetical protein PHG67_09060 [Bacteroidales bacterium]|nr:hypothetical protein [Bacteroidales bacterium]HOI32604.1 hypothetical protein [Bacteroidales bacterium]